MSDLNESRLREVLKKHAKPDPDKVGKLPKPTRKDATKGKCAECGGWHGLPAVHLDYLGHAEVTRILIEEDPVWSWEPFAIDETGPVVGVRNGTAELWIRLTLHGKTLPAVGTAPASKPEVAKELISDALRNGAMRFGIGLSLWSKEEWSDGESEPLWERKQAKGRAFTILKENMPETSARGVVNELWDGHGPTGNGPWPASELTAFWSAATARAVEAGAPFGDDAA